MLGGVPSWPRGCRNRALVRALRIRGRVAGCADRVWRRQCSSSQPRLAARLPSTGPRPQPDCQTGGQQAAKHSAIDWHRRQDHQHSQGPLGPTRRTSRRRLADRHGGDPQSRRHLFPRPIRQRRVHAEQPFRQLQMTSLRSPAAQVLRRAVFMPTNSFCCIQRGLKNRAFPPHLASLGVEQQLSRRARRREYLPAVWVVARWVQRVTAHGVPSAAYNRQREARAGLALPKMVDTQRAQVLVGAGEDAVRRQHDLKTAGSIGFVSGDRKNGGARLRRLWQTHAPGEVGVELPVIEGRRTQWSLRSPRILPRASSYLEFGTGGVGASAALRVLRHQACNGGGLRLPLGTQRNTVATLTSIYGDLLATYSAPTAGIVIGRSVDPAAETGARILHMGRLAVPGGVQFVDRGAAYEAWESAT